MSAADIIIVSICVPLFIMMGVVCYVMLAMILKEEFGRNIWPFKKEEEE